MNRIWKWLVCASLFMTMIFSSGPVNAEPKAVDDWMPAEGLYVRKTASGIPNGRIDVIVIKDFYMNPSVLVGVESRNYTGNSYEGSDMAPRIYIAGTMDASRVVLSYGYSDKRDPMPDPRVLPPMTSVVYNSDVKNKSINLTPQMFDQTRAMRTDPDLAGTYVWQGNYASPSAFMAMAWVRQQNPQVTGLEPGLDYRFEDNFVGDGMEKNYPGVGPIKPSYELKAYDGNKLIMLFLVSKDFKQIYRIKPDGDALLIYNAEGGVG